MGVTTGFTLTRAQISGVEGKLADFLFVARRGEIQKDFLWDNSKLDRLNYLVNELLDIFKAKNSKAPSSFVVSDTTFTRVENALCELVINPGMDNLHLINIASFVYASGSYREGR